MSEEYDVIVVGGGPAGSICAYTLGQNHVKVLLIDKAQFPRDKTCGDFISARLSDKMKRLGVYDAVKSAPHAFIDDLLFSHPAVGGFLIRESLNRSNLNRLCVQTREFRSGSFRGGQEACGCFRGHQS